MSPNFDVEFVLPNENELTISVDADDRDEAIKEAKEQLIQDINNARGNDIIVYDEDGEEVK